ncbi:hypothetical protein [Saccharopolyspora mangrovi]|uniref:Uncharacterized protein n=1 Tax=Saccharopolyspora mangrovi TaxID=3082379 RepID=A0ABU6AIK3_9PSEU|nr:hypothetical protein [Saccharopolyspora sp. S2-29]MEB3371297.1 hypothetical protein [Saccharopolyspora sp. S2-29]
MDLPNITVFRYGPDESRVFLNDAHLIGVLEHSSGEEQVRVSFYGPSGQRFALPQARGITDAVTSIIIAALHYDYRPHEIAVGYFTPCGYGIWCPTCHVAGTALSRYYNDRVEAEERAVGDHEDLYGQPAVLVPKPGRLAPDSAPPNAWPTTDHDRT